MSSNVYMRMPPQVLDSSESLADKSFCSARDDSLRSEHATEWLLEAWHITVDPDFTNAA